MGITANQDKFAALLKKEGILHGGNVKTRREAASEALRQGLYYWSVEVELEDFPKIPGAYPDGGYGFTYWGCRPGLWVWALEHQAEVIPWIRAKVPQMIAEFREQEFPIDPANVLNSGSQVRTRKQLDEFVANALYYLQLDTSAPDQPEDETELEEYHAECSRLRAEYAKEEREILRAKDGFDDYLFAQEMLPLFTPKPVKVVAPLGPEPAKQTKKGEVSMSWLRWTVKNALGDTKAVREMLKGAGVTVDLRTKKGWETAFNLLFAVQQIAA